MNHFLNHLQGELEQWLSAVGEPSFRAKQIRGWLFQHRAESFDDMTNVSKSLREKLNAEFQLWSTKIAKHSTADDGTEKLLLSLADNAQIECVLLRDGLRRTICISTQVGCAMGCVFCASGLDGVERNLTVGEILEQVLRLQRLLPSDERLSHIVVMGMGEPLANVDSLLLALDQISPKDALGISSRRITISTVGLPPAMRKLADQNRHYQLAVSLHAPNDELRNRLVPVNKNIGLDQILQAADAYFESSGRRLTFEYVLLGGINDLPVHARELLAQLKGRPALLNIIPYNPVAGLPYKTPSTAAQADFTRILESGGLSVKTRKRKGSRIDAACGQLRRISMIQGIAPATENPINSQ